MANTKEIVAQLQRSLRQFGLNPRDWTVRLLRNRSNAALIRHRQDPDLKIHGSLANGQWSQLEFLGI